MPRYLPLIVRDRLQWYVHSSPHEYIPCLHLCSVCALSGRFHRPLLLAHGTEVFQVVYHRSQMTWKTISGSLNRISAGSVTNVWGVSSSFDIFRYTGDDSNPWVQIPGVLYDIGVGADGTVWGVDSNTAIFRYTPGMPATDNWLRIAGNLTRISVGSCTNVWGVNADGGIFRYSGDDSNPWINIPIGPTGGLSDIGAGADGTVLGVNSSGQAYRYTGDQGDPNHWAIVPGSTTLSAISCGVKTNVWGANAPASGLLAVYTFLNDGWVQINGGLSDIGTGADGVVWGVNAASIIFRWIRD